MSKETNILDHTGMPDSKSKTDICDLVHDFCDAVNPLERDPIRMPLDVGVRSINSLLSVGRGQRLGLFAGSGVAKVCCWA